MPREYETYTGPQGQQQTFDNTNYARQPTSSGGGGGSAAAAPSGPTYVGPPMPDDHWAEQQANADRTHRLSQDIFNYNKAQDDLRKKNVTESMAKIKTLFGGRSGLYDQLSKESMGLNKARLLDLQGDASRNLKFGLARAGNVGGSVEVDKNRDMAEKMGLGLGQAEIYAQGQGDQLRAQDEALRGSLSTLASSGAMTGAQVGSQGKSALSGLRGTASYMRNIDNTFDNLSGQIGAAGKKNVQQPRTTSTNFGY